MIPKAAVEAALYALFPDEPDIKEFKSVFWLPTINTILEAAAPHIAAQVLEDAAKEIIAPGASSVASAWLNTRANMIRPTP